MRHEHDCETIEFQNALHAFHSLGSLLLPSPCAYLTMHTLSRHLRLLAIFGTGTDQLPVFDLPTPIPGQDSSRLASAPRP